MATEPEEAPLDQAQEEEEGGPIKPFLEHLEDLRWVLIKCISSLVVGMALCMAGAPYLVDILKRPLPADKVKLEFLGPLAGFWVSMKVALFGGVVLALPFILYFIGEYVIPALKKLERKYFLRAVVIGAGLFLGGAFLCYFLMLPISLKAVLQYNDWLNVPTNIWRAEEYFSFVCWFMIGMGLSFEAPVIILTLVKLGLVSHSTLVKSRRYVFVINLVVCAFITPDPITTFFMVIPMQVLMEVCIWISAYWERQKKAEEAALLASEQGNHSLSD
jgi:sec-independent protein translocase protein TatC